MIYRTTSFSRDNLKWLGEIFSDTKHRAVSLWQLSFLFS